MEDEWPKARTLAHQLHDKIFASLPPEKAVELELYETESPSEAVRSKISVVIEGSEPTLVFEYIFIVELETLKDIATSSDFVIVDIMRNSSNGRFESILDLVVELFRGGDFSRERWRYFSAYPENIPQDSELIGMVKKDHHQLIQFLFDRISEQQSWT